MSTDDSLHADRRILAARSPQQVLEAIGVLSAGEERVSRRVDAQRAEIVRRANEYEAKAKAFLEETAPKLEERRQICERAEAIAKRAREAFDKFSARRVDWSGNLQHQGRSIRDELFKLDHPTQRRLRNDITRAQSRLQNASRVGSEADRRAIERSPVHEALNQAASDAGGLMVDTDTCLAIRTRLGQLIEDHASISTEIGPPRDISIDDQHSEWIAEQAAAGDKPARAKK